MKFALSIGDSAFAHYIPTTSSEESAPSKEALDFLLERGIDTTQIKNAGQANLAISRLRERERLGLASPKQLTLLKQLGMPEDKLTLMSGKQAGAIIGRSFRR